MNKKRKKVPQLSDAEFLIRNYCIVITSFQNEFNMKLQGKGKIIADVFSDIIAFDMKLKLINMLKSELDPLPFL